MAPDRLFWGRIGWFVAVAAIGIAIWYFRVIANGQNNSSPAMQILMMILLVVLPYGTAIICGAITEWAAKLCPGGALSAVWRSAFIFFPRAWTFWARLVLRYITDPVRWHCTKWSCGSSSSRSIFKEGQVKRRDVRYWHIADIRVALHMSAIGGKADITLRNATRVFIKNMAMCRAWPALPLFVRLHPSFQDVGLPTR